LKVPVLLKINIALFVCNCCGRMRVLNIQGVSEIGGLVLGAWSVERNIEKTSHKTCPRTLGFITTTLDLKADETGSHFRQ
jgi:hypothetical protein